MSEPIVKVEHLSHRYSVQWAIRDISFEIGQTGTTGLLGSNGAGKSTTMNIICGVLSQTDGEVRIDGINLRENPVEAKKNIGFLPQKPPLYGDLTVDEYLKYAARLRRMESSKIPAALESVKERCGIAHFSKRLIKNLSGGYQQRVGIAQAIIHDPKVVVMDEPTNGLDIPSKAQFRSAILKYTPEDSTIVISTHQVRDLENVIDPIIILDRQDVLLNASLDRISEKLFFDYGTVLHPDSLYSEQLPGGFIQVCRNLSGADSKVNIEALFNAVHKNKELIKSLFENE